MTANKPSVGRVVHYVSYGTPNGEYTSECRSTIVTEVDAENPNRIGGCVINPTGFFFHNLASGGLEYDASEKHRGGTWHWPERV